MLPYNKYVNGQLNKFLKILKKKNYTFFNKHLDNIQVKSRIKHSNRKTLHHDIILTHMKESNPALCWWLSIKGGADKVRDQKCKEVGYLENIK